jgi:hypothetical protein
MGRCASFADEGVVIGTNTGAVVQSSGETLPATGKSLMLAFAEVAKLEEAKVKRHRLYWDQLAFESQLGLLDMPQAVRS